MTGQLSAVRQTSPACPTNQDAGFCCQTHFAAAKRFINMLQGRR